ncbi:hypothetical protein [Campylobacter concisus]|uniref:Uncharacterized protein n=1 Tax=Campylobacter concisus TaxID=199 RepID=A0A2R4NZR8_9BACT|nr:hypothetical protein [Campylobacter concisus]AVX43671.1 hypothetical protein CCS77_0610 [Campylobacter concisus]
MINEMTKDQIYKQLDNIASTKEYLKLAELAKFELKDLIESFLKR